MLFYNSLILNEIKFNILTKISYCFYVFEFGLIFLWYLRLGRAEYLNYPKS